MNSKSLSISEFKAHCTEELREVAELGVTLHITRHGKTVATIIPPQMSGPQTMADWIGSGAGTVLFPEDYDPHEPAAPLEDWEALREEPTSYKLPLKPKTKRGRRK